MKNTFVKLKTGINDLSIWRLFAVMRQRGVVSWQLMCGYLRGYQEDLLQHWECSSADIWWSEQHKEQRMGQVPPRSSITRGTCYLWPCPLAPSVHALRHACNPKQTISHKSARGKHTNTARLLICVCVCACDSACSLMEHISSRNRRAAHRSRKGTLQQMVWGHHT